jgi:hypothetical protein
MRPFRHDDMWLVPAAIALSELMRIIPEAFACS